MADHDTTTPVRMGRIGYLNTLPVYHHLDVGDLDCGCVMVSGPPAACNRRMAAGELDIASVSSIEYARRFAHYDLVPGLAIGSRGPVRSVLLLSRVPLQKLRGETILVSSQTHTSAALLRLLLAEHYGIDVHYESGDAATRLADNDPPVALLAIGDEALVLREHEAFPYALDLGESWREWTGLPFIFGVWVVRRGAAGPNNERAEAIDHACRALMEAKELGVTRLDAMAALAAESGILSEPDLRRYFQGLCYDFGQEEAAGLRCFFGHLVRTGVLETMPELRFWSPTGVAPGEEEKAA